ncbi:MAG TPA: inner membrane CreD family protein [Candidatus Acidoferrales bacterium]|jgi:inner membrane protein involved in colicin E2 resistance|nr:inner membrane CreD family protein [Candidatus Acidoferrales bacterium]
MLKRLIAIAVIFCGASIAWLILGQTILARTNESDSTQTEKLTAQWGSAQTQTAPDVFARIAVDTYNADKKRVERSYEDVAVPFLSTKIDVDLGLEQRRKGLLWYNLYAVKFVSHYRIRNATNSSRLSLHFPFPSADGSYTNFACRIGGLPIDDATALSGNRVSFSLDPGRETTIDVSYMSRGMESWQYRFGDGVQSLSNFSLAMTTDFSAIDFPPKTLLPVSEARYGNGWRLVWNYTSLVTGNGIGMAFPIPLQPGPLAQRITFWAPIALLFYLFVMLVVTTLRKVDLHPVNYFFLACAFFAFHLLFAYLVDRIPIEVAFAICSVVSMALTITYLRLVVGWQFAAVESGIAQFLYLVLFSYALFNEGWAGLAITCGAIVTLFAMMQLTGRVSWRERFAPLSS